jgi:hypothetical protein
MLGLYHVEKGNEAGFMVIIKYSFKTEKNINSGGY